MGYTLKINKVEKFIRGLGRNFNLTVATNLIIPSFEYDNLQGKAVIHNRRKAITQNELLEAVYTALVNLDVHLPAMATELLSQLFKVKAVPQLSVRRRRLVFARAGREYEWGTPPLGVRS